MRQAGALAAAVLLALALGAAGCNLVSSLTPFGIGTRDYSGTGGENLNGDWVGTTASSGEVKFQLGNNEVSNLRFLHIEGACTLTFEALTATDRVVNDGFIVEIALSQGRFVATSKFTTASSCSGTYFFEGLPTGGCPTAGTGTFVAEKTF